MKTEYTIFRPDGSVEHASVDWPEEPGFERIAALVEPLLDGADLEHVTVLHDNKRADMFVDETGLLKNLPRNEQATAIYRAATIRREPKRHLETLPHIVGTAILFRRIVWM